MSSAHALFTTVRGQGTSAGFSTGKLEVFCQPHINTLHQNQTEILLNLFSKTALFTLPKVFHSLLRFWVFSSLIPIFAELVLLDEQLIELKSDKSSSSRASGQSERDISSWQLYSSFISFMQ